MCHLKDGKKGGQGGKGGMVVPTRFVRGEGEAVPTPDFVVIVLRGENRGRGKGAETGG